MVIQNLDLKSNYDQQCILKTAIQLEQELFNKAEHQELISLAYLGVVEDDRHVTYVNSTQSLNMMMAFHMKGPNSYKL
jgi:hypothetical protein